MQITATELKRNVGKYISMADTEDIYIVRNGKPVARLTRPPQDRVALLDSLVGIVRAEDTTLDDIKAERLEKQ